MRGVEGILRPALAHVSQVISLELWAQWRARARPVTPQEGRCSVFRTLYLPYLVCAELGVGTMIPVQVLSEAQQNQGPAPPVHQT